MNKCVSTFKFREVMQEHTPSVTLTYREHIGWTSSKLITQIISLESRRMVVQ